jgi:hypothetical protein
MGFGHCALYLLTWTWKTNNVSLISASQVWSNPQLLSVPMLFVELEKVSKRTNFRVVLYTLQDMAVFLCKQD